MNSGDRNSIFSFGENDEKPSSSSVLPDFGAPPVSHDRADYRNVVKHNLANALFWIC